MVVSYGMGSAPPVRQYHSPGMHTPSRHAPWNGTSQLQPFGFVAHSPGSGGGYPHTPAMQTPMTPSFEQESPSCSVAYTHRPASLRLAIMHATGSHGSPKSSSLI